MAVNRAFFRGLPGLGCATDGDPAQQRVRTFSPSVGYEKSVLVEAKPQPWLGGDHADARQTAGKIRDPSSIASIMQVYAIPIACQREGRGQRMLNCTGVEVRTPRHNSREHPREAATPMTRSRAFAQDNVPRRQNASVTRCCRPQPNGRTRQISPFSEAAHAISPSQQFGTVLRRVMRFQRVSISVARRQQSS